jgi:hypothetical protein
MEDEFGRPLSDDGQWVWDGTAWRPTATQAGPGGPGTGGLDSTMVAPRDYQPTGGQPAQGDYYQSAYPAGGYGPGGPAGPGAPGGPGQPPPPWYRRQAVMVSIIGALLVISAVLVTVLLLTRGDDNNNAAPSSPSASTPSPTTPPTTAPPTTEAPTTPPPTTEPPTSPPPTTPPPADNTVEPGIYDCTNAGQPAGFINFQGLNYRTSNNGTGTYDLDPTTGDMIFTGADLSDFDGTYDPTGPSIVLTTTTGVELRCAQ